MGVTPPLSYLEDMADKVYNIANSSGGDNQTLSLEGYKLSISNGNSVNLPNSKIGQINVEVSTHSGQSMYINQIWNFTHLTFDNFAVRNMYEMPDGFRPIFTITVPLTLKETGEVVGYEEIEPSGDMTYHVFDKYKDQWADIWDKINTCEVSYYTDRPYVTLNN